MTTQLHPKKLLQNLFQFLASIRLAIPLMTSLILVVSVGTILESRYNSQIARILIYDSYWFEGLLILLWLNIFCSLASRYPYRKHHLGFMITHLGLLILLIGAKITAVFGIDGQLRVLTGEQSNLVSLSNPILKITSSQSEHSSSSQIPWSHKYPLDRSLKPRDTEQMGLSQINTETGITVDHFLPFVASPSHPSHPSNHLKMAQAESTLALDFSLQSQFFNVDESLSLPNNPEIQLGPATFRLISLAPSPADPTSTSSPSPSKATLLIRNEQTQEVLEKIPLDQLRQHPQLLVHGIKIQLLQVFEGAAVVGGKLIDTQKKGDNPAVGLMVGSGEQSKREVVFSRFPTFSLNPTGTFGLRFEYLVPHLQNHLDSQSQTASQDPTPHHLVEFRLISSQPPTVQVRLLKNRAPVLDQSMKIGDVLQTPWMGMKITLKNLNAHGSTGPNPSRSEEVRPVELRPGIPLPPSAIHLHSDQADGNGIWLAEGTTRTLQTHHGSYSVYYGPDFIELPFQVQLDQFSKVDYPNSDTPMSFESTIRFSDVGIPSKIQMNQPLEHNGYTFYQSSYELGPGITPASIFSVNHDPGRTIKYFGAVLLSIGILTFTLMRSRWLMNKLRLQAWTVGLVFLLMGTVNWSWNSPSAYAAQNPNTYQDFTPESAKNHLQSFVQGIDTSLIESLPVQSHGRLKPLVSLARESILFLAGQFRFFDLSAIQIYLGLMTTDAAPYVELIQIRDPDLRVKLGFSKAQRYYTLQQLKSTPLEQWAHSILARQAEGGTSNSSSLTDQEKSILEVYQQTWLLKEILTGSHLDQALLLSSQSEGQQASARVIEKAHQYLTALRNRDFALSTPLAIELQSWSRTQPMPELFQSQLPHLKTEVNYIHTRPFLWAAAMYLILGMLWMSGLGTRYLTSIRILALTAIPFLIHATGFAVRVSITGFAPVTNMYGTMIWVAFGVVLFGSLLFARYQNRSIYGLLLTCAGIILLFTENVPLILSPDLDPIVAVLRNNFWLTLHVLTISISYAAFTIAMILGNVGLIRSSFMRLSSSLVHQLSHLTYRAIQIGVFLLTVGIILGGWWADYSWGRFWGWDPKETWALIADMGFLILLHARYASWIGPYGLLAFAPLAYLLVIMAWYGVNFVLASGLHSYGFSTGGTYLVLGFVLFQLGLSVITGVLKQFKR